VLFLHFSSALPYSTLGFLRLWLKSSLLPRLLSRLPVTLASHRLPIVPPIFQRFNLGSHGLFWLPLVNPGSAFGSDGLWLMVQWLLGIVPGVSLTASSLIALALESLNEIRIILTWQHRVPEQGDNYTVQGRRHPLKSPLNIYNGTTLRIGRISASHYVACSKGKMLSC
jgi:hypothetical protein